MSEVRFYTEEEVIQDIEKYEGTVLKSEPLPEGVTPRTRRFIRLYSDIWKPSVSVRELKERLDEYFTTITYSFPLDTYVDESKAFNVYGLVAAQDGSFGDMVFIAATDESDIDAAFGSTLLDSEYSTFVVYCRDTCENLILKKDVH